MSAQPTREPCPDYVETLVSYGELRRYRAIEAAAMSFVLAEKAWVNAGLSPAFAGVADGAAASLRAALARPAEEAGDA